MTASNLVPLATRLAITVGDPKFRRELLHAAGVVERVHLVPGGGASIRVEEETDAALLGGYEPGFPGLITVRFCSADPGFTLLHEVGHHLDWEVHAVAGSWASEASAELDGWWSAIQESSAYRDLDHMYRHPKRVTTASGFIVESDPATLDYYLDPRELFARSYAQHIAVESGNPILLGQLQSLKGEFYPEQWEASDFDGIGEALDTVLRGRGWQR